MLMKHCKLSRRWFSSAGYTICIWKHSFHLVIGSPGSCSIKDGTAVSVSDSATVWSARACCTPLWCERNSTSIADFSTFNDVLPSLFRH